MNCRTSWSAGGRPNSKIRDLWYAMDAAAVQVIQCGGTARVRNVVFAREYDVVQGVSCMTITLPLRAQVVLYQSVSGHKSVGSPIYRVYGHGPENEKVEKY